MVEKNTTKFEKQIVSKKEEKSGKYIRIFINHSF